MFIFFVALHLSATIVDVAEREYAEFCRMNTPMRPPPLGLLVHGSKSLHRSQFADALRAVAHRTSPNLFVVDLDLVKHRGDLWPIFGAEPGFLDSDRVSPLKQALGFSAQGCVLMLGRTGQAVRESLLGRIDEFVRLGTLKTARGTLKLKNHALLIEVHEDDQIRPGLKVRDLARHADRSVTEDGVRLDLFTGFHARAVLSWCTGALATP